MNRLDGRALATPVDLRADVVVVGSGPAGSAVARVLARAGARVVVVEAGPWIEPGAFPESTFDAMALAYRDLGASVAWGRAPIPCVQGRMVGGTSPINGAICWRLPRDVYDGWVAADPALAEALPWAEIEAATDEIEKRINVLPTDPAIAGAKNRLMAKGAAALGLEHRPIRRNVVGCEGLARCMQGCPRGHKQSADLTLLADAEAAGATVLSSTSVQAIEVQRGRARGVRGRTDGGAPVWVAADRVVLAASALQSPVLLLDSGLRQGPVGRHFQAHPGVSMVGRFAEPVRMWEGATQGHEVIGLRHEGLKFESLSYGFGLMAARMHGVGRTLAAEIDDRAHEATWGVAIRAEAQGRVRAFRGRPLIFYQPTAADVAKFRRGLRVLGDLFLAAGAECVRPGVRGVADRLTQPAELARLEAEGPRSVAAYTAAVTHMFSTCRMSSDPRTGVVRPDFRHHAVEGLYVADSSVFPTSTGVNPQVAIMALATLAGRHLTGARA